MSKQPREFYISGINFDTYTIEPKSAVTGFITTDNPGKSEAIRVIEYSAYQELVTKAEALITALKEARYEVLGCSEEWAQKSATKIWQAIAEYKEEK